MREDNVLKTIHQIQKRLRDSRKNLSWEQETKLIARNAQEIARRYKMQIWPEFKSPYYGDNF